MKLKVCILTDAWYPVWGGGQQHILEVASRLKERGVDIDIVAPNLMEIKNSKLKIQNPSNHHQIKVLRLGTAFDLDDFLGRIIFALRLIPFLLISNYDIYHSHSYSTSIFLPLVKYLKHKKICFTLHGYGKDVIGVKRKSIFRRVFRLIGDVLVFRYPYDCLFLIGLPRDKHKFKARNVTELVNGVDVQAFDKVKVKKEKIFTILFVGRFDPVKNLPLLLEAVKRLKENNKRFKLKLVGGGYEEEKLKKMVKESGLEDIVEFTGWLFGDDLIKVYKSSHLFILPSLSEGFPLTILEAWAAKLPVITTNVGNKLINNNVNGCLFQSKETENLSKLMEKFLLQPDFLKMGSNGYLLAKEKYRWSKVTDLVYKSYKVIHQQFL